LDLVADHPEDHFDVGAVLVDVGAIGVYRHDFASFTRQLHPADGAARFIEYREAATIADIRGVVLMLQNLPLSRQTEGTGWPVAGQAAAARSRGARVPRT
jgi:hypothetical protein